MLTDEQMTEDAKNKLCRKCQRNDANYHHRDSSLVKDEDFITCFHNLKPIEKDGSNCSYFLAVNKELK